MNTIKTGLLIAIFNYSAFRFNWSMLEYYIFILLLSISSNQNDEVSLDVTKHLSFDMSLYLRWILLQPLHSCRSTI